MFKLTVMSFGFKHGLCEDVNILYDVRGFKNPYYEDDLRDKCGIDDDVYEYVFADEAAEALFMPSVTAAKIVIDKVMEKGWESFTVAYACTGGQHRSVAFAKRAYEHFLSLGYDVTLYNRDCEKK